MKSHFLTQQLSGKTGAVLFIALAATAFIFSGCSADNAYQAPAQMEIQLQTSATLGSYLTDKDGRTLYYFANDSATVNTCTSAACMGKWPVFYSEKLSASTTGSGLTFSDFGVITTAGGAKQSTYMGRPLYYYAPAGDGVREAVGATSGEKVGNVWFVAKPDYTIMITNAQLVGANGKNYTFTITSPTPTYVEGNGKSAYFTDAHGVALYIFKPDKQNTNTFTKPDLSNNAVWPVYEMDKIVVPSLLDKSLFGVITVYGKKQMTYKGWPLYYFGQDAMTMGLTKGVSVPSPGVWPVATKDLVPATP
ncbi:COG4315 family predicted lipoprotein [Niabella soli]|uniref:Lipoprotein n=1 Tax=Niabella soli DSM 19437 TaxID=929713 RepID=W0F397_9BACT|nr:hypothetical protein [Niabella soli]AHF15974.1 hypothetical protein NIASO_14060 [Niabella soli DSM 19437]